MEQRSRVCVTGGGGYIASWLIKKLLQRGYTVHATLRNLADGKKTGLLKGLPGADERLELFEADMYAAAAFEPAINGCEFVFLVATPLGPPIDGSKYKDTTEAAVDAARVILKLCEQAKTVKRVIHTASMTASSPLKEDGTGYKDFMDESCWTPLHLPLEYPNDNSNAYASSKVLSEKELLSYNKEEDKQFEVVTLACGLVGGDTILPYAPESIQLMIAPLTGSVLANGFLKLLQTIAGSLPLVHVDDVCEAHIICMERPPSSMAGRFLCAAAYLTMQQFVDHLAEKFPELPLRIKEVAGGRKGVPVRSDKLVDLGFRYKYGTMDGIVDSTVACARRFALL